MLHRIARWWALSSRSFTSAEYHPQDSDAKGIWYFALIALDGSCV
jgi:hypothetical protein